MNDKYIECKVCFEKIYFYKENTAIKCNKCNTKFILIPRNGAMEISIMILVTFIFGIIFSGLLLVIIDTIFFIIYLYYIIKNPVRIKIKYKGQA